jgi:tape measure domain-containing protein
MSQDLASLFIKIDSTGVIAAVKDLDKLEGGSRKAETATQSLTATFDKMKTAMQALAASWAVVQLAQYTREIVQAQVAWERMNVSMEAASGSMVKAKQNMAFVQAESQRLGLSLETQSKAFIKLMAAAQGTSLQGEGARKIFSAVATASTALQLSADETSGALYAIGQMMSKGTVQAEELRGQLGERLPGAFQVAARAMGVTTQGLGKMLEQGQVFSEDFLPKFAAALNEQYAGSVEKASKSTSAQIERMKTAIFQAKVAIGEAFRSSTLEGLKTATDTFKKLQDVMESPEADRALKELASSFSTLVKQIGNDLPGALNNTVTTISTLINLFNSLPSGAVGAAGAGIVGRMVFGGSAGAIIASVVMLNSMLDTLNKRTETHLQRLQSLQSNIRNMTDVVMGKKDWNTGASKIGEVTVPEAAPLDPSNLNFILEQLGNTEAIAEASKIINQKALDKAKKAEADWLKDKQKARLEYWELVAKDEEEANKLTSKRLIEKWEEEEKWRQDSLKATGDYWESLAKEQADADKEEVKRLLAKWDDEKNTPQKAADEMAKQAQLYKDLGGLEDEYRAKKLQWIELEAKAREKAYGKDFDAAKWIAQQKQKMNEEVSLRDIADREAAFSSMASNFDKMAQLYAEDSSARQALSNLSKAATLAEMGVLVQKNLMIAVGAVANQGNGEPYTAFGRIAAMVAVMAGVLGMAGIAFGGGGGGGASFRPSMTGTTLGTAAGTESESISNTYKILEDTYDLQKTNLVGMYSSMRELNTTMKELAVSAFKLGGVMTSTTGSVYSRVTSAGYKFGETTAGGAAAGGANATGYKEEIGYGIPGATYAGGYFQSLTSTVAAPKQFSETMALLSKNIIDVAVKFGAVQTTVENIKIAAGTLDVTGLSYEDALKRTNAFFSGIADTLVSKIPELKSLVDIYGAGLEAPYETIMRLYNDLQSVTNILEMTGQSFNAIATSITIPFPWIGQITLSVETLQEAKIRITESLIEIAGGLDKLTEAANTYYDKFFTDVEKQDRIGKNITAALGFAPTTREDYRSRVEGLDLSNPADQEQYVRMMEWSSLASDFFDVIEEGMPKVKTAADILAELNDLNERHNQLGKTQVQLNQMWIDSLDVSNQALGRHIIDEEQRLSLQDEYNQLTMTSAELRALERNEIEVSNRALWDSIQAIKDRKIALQEEVAAQKTIVDTFKGYVDKLKSARESMQMEGSTFARQQETSAQLAFDVVLSQAKLGDFSGIGSLDRSLSTMTGAANSTAGFSTRQEYEANYWKTYNAIAELEALTGTQLSIEERTLNTLQSQLDVLNNIATNIAVIAGAGGTAVLSPNPVSLATGMDYIPMDNFSANLHEGEAVLNRKAASAWRGGADSGELAQAIKELKEEVNVIGSAIAKNTQKSSKIFDRWDQDGLPPDRDGIIAKWDTAGIPATRP